MKVIFFGHDTMGLNVLKKLEELDHEICCFVLRNLDVENPLKGYAEAKEYPCFQPVNVNDPNFVLKLKSFNADINILMNYDQIVKTALIESAKHKTINCHNGLLPNYRGGGGVYGAIINNEKEFGITVHYVNEMIDAGDIIIQKKIPIKLTDTMGDLQEKAANVHPEIFEEALQLIKKYGNSVKTEKQEHKEGSYFPKKADWDELINWENSSLDIYNQVRARTPGPKNFTFLNDKKINVLKVSLSQTPDYKGSIGQVTEKSERGVKVKTGDNALWIEAIELDGLAVKPAFKVGTVLGMNIPHEISRLKEEVRKLRGLINQKSKKKEISGSI